MVKEELKSLWHNKLLMVILCAIILIPSIYAGFFLSSMWDPYGDLTYLPVAVVNKDESVVYHDKELAVGKELADSLKENDSMAFNVVDEQVAWDGLENGTYYMVVTIPKEFSHNATTVMEKDPTKLCLEFATNPGRNYISMKLGESAVKEIKANITEEIVRTYAENVFDSLTEVEDGFSEAVDGTQDMLDGQDQLIEGNDTITENLGLVNDGALALSNGAKELKDGLTTYTGGVAQVDDGVTKLAGGVSTLESSAVSGAGELAQGAGTLQEGIKQYTKGVSDAAKGSETLKKNNAAIKKGASDLSDGTKTLKDSIQNYTDGVSAAKTGADTLAGNNEKLNSGAQQLKSGADALAKGGSDVLAGLNQMSSTIGASLSAENQAQIDAAAKGLTQLDAGIDQLNSQANSPGTGLVDSMTYMSNSVGQLEQATAGAMNGVGAVYEGLSQIMAAIDAGQITTAAEVKGLMDANHILASLKSSNPAAPGIYEATAAADEGLKSLNAGMKQTLATDGSGSIVNLSQGISQLNAGADQVLAPSATALSDLKSGLLNAKGALDTQLIPGVTQLNGGLQSLSEGSSTLQTGLSTYTAGVDSLQQGLNTLDGYNKALNKGASDLNSGAKTLKSGLSTYTDGVATLNKGLGQLESNNKKLNDGSNELTQGAGKLQSGLSDGTKQLMEGTLQLKAGTKQLTENSPKLTNGATKLSDGAVSLADGSKKLTDGSKELGEGLATLNEGTITLHDALEDGKEEIAENKASEESLDMFAAPVETKEEMVTTVENNGHAMAAYMLSVGLWVGCLAFCLMYPLVDYKGKFKNGLAWWASKAVIAGPVALAMSFVVMAILTIALGFHPVSWSRTLGVAMVVAIAFMTIMYFSNVLLGKVGSFLMLIFMVLQLTGSAGTYPIEVSGSLAQKLHIYMPFTYSVDAFRSAISGGGSVAHEMTVLICISIVFTILTILLFTLRGWKLHHEKKMIYDWIEEKGLA